jgi:small-conductance mechanosensitive channel
MDLLLTSLFFLGIIWIVAWFLYVLWRKRKDKRYFPSPYLIFALFVGNAIFVASLIGYPYTGKAPIDIPITIALSLTLITIIHVIHITIGRKMREMGEE